MLFSLQKLCVLWVLFFSVFANAHSKQYASPTKMACSEYSNQYCVKVLFNSAPNSYDESKFQLELIAAEGLNLKFLGARLWMQMGDHGHGSAPLQIENLESNKYEITNAWFVMDGDWLILIRVKAGEEEIQINFPVIVNEYFH